MDGDRHPGVTLVRRQQEVSARDITVVTLLAALHLLHLVPHGRHLQREGEGTGYGGVREESR